MNNSTLNAVSPTPVGTVQKEVGGIVMLAVASDGASFYINGGSYEFFVPASHVNYAALFSLLLAAQSNGYDLAVKYNTLSTVPLGNRRTVAALATGANAVISGNSF